MKRPTKKTCRLEWSEEQQMWLEEDSSRKKYNIDTNGWVTIADNYYDDVYATFTSLFKHDKKYSLKEVQDMWLGFLQMLDYMRRYYKIDLVQISNDEVLP